MNVVLHRVKQPSVYEQRKQELLGAINLTAYKERYLFGDNPKSGADIRVKPELLLVLRGESMKSLSAILKHMILVQNQYVLTYSDNGIMTKMSLL